MQALAMPTSTFYWSLQTQLAMNNNEQGQVANCVARGHHTTMTLRREPVKRKGCVKELEDECEKRPRKKNPREKGPTNAT
jgi:hypothetical protein